MPEIDIIDRARMLLSSMPEAEPTDDVVQSEPTDDVIRDLISEVLALRGVAARSDAAVAALIRANGRWSTLAGFLYGLMTRTCERQALEIAREKWEEAHAENHS